MYTNDLWNGKIHTSSKTGVPQEGAGWVVSERYCDGIFAVEKWKHSL